MSDRLLFITVCFYHNLVSCKFDKPPILLCNSGIRVCILLILSNCSGFSLVRKSMICWDVPLTHPGKSSSHHGNLMYEIFRTLCRCLFHLLVISPHRVTSCPSDHVHQLLLPNLAPFLAPFPFLLMPCSSPMSYDLSDKRFVFALALGPPGSISPWAMVRAITLAIRRYKPGTFLPSDATGLTLPQSASSGALSSPSSPRARHLPSTGTSTSSVPLRGLPLL